MSLKNLFTALLFFLLPAFAISQSGEYIFVSSRNSNSVKWYDYATGSFLGDFVPPGSGDLALPQEVVWHPDGFLLVTGRGNTAVKKYDGNTGDYLGNFTHGYNLDNPTKTTIGPDSLLYVSQWGTVKNKVVRFNLKTGAFVDEFTSIGVPNGCGHAWDAAGNLYVARYGNGANGQVLKFGPNGASAGVFIPSGQLKGPVNVWFDTTGSMLVADWTLGKVLKFNGSTGAYEGTPISGLSNVEGFAFDNHGRLYLCDWTANLVYRYDFATKTLTPFLQTGGLMAPNSVLIREMAATPAREKTEGNLALTVRADSAGGSIHVDYFLKNTASTQVEVLNMAGQPVAIIFSGKQSAGEYRLVWDGAMTNGARAVPGVYVIRLKAVDLVVARQVVWP